MSIMDTNEAVLNYLRSNFPNSVDQINLEGNFLVYGDKRIDISKFNLQLFFLSIPDFDTNFSFNDLDSKEFFEIINLHARFNKGRLKDEKAKGQEQENISLKSFYKLFDGSKTGSFSEEERHIVNSYYDFLESLFQYEEYLLPEYKEVLDKFRDFSEKISLSVNDDKDLTIRQKELISKRATLEEKYKDGDKTPKSVKEERYVKELKAEFSVPASDDGEVSIFAVIGIIVGVAIILTAVTLYILG